MSETQLSIGMRALQAANELAKAGDPDGSEAAMNAAAKAIQVLSPPNQLLALLALVSTVIERQTDRPLAIATCAAVLARMLEHDPPRRTVQ